MGRKHYNNFEDLIDELDHEPLIDSEEDETGLLDEDDLAMLTPSPPPPPKKPKKPGSKKR